MKLVRENLNFERGSGDKLNNLGIGKIVRIENWLKEMEIVSRDISKDYGYIINDDLTIDIHNLYIYRKNIIELPDFIQFRNATGYCNIQCNMLKSLKGFPIRVEENFDCRFNGLESLD